MTFSSAKSPCQLHKDGRFSAHCQVIADPDFSNMRCRQWQQQLLVAAPDSSDNLHRSWFMHPLRQSFLWASESCKPSLAPMSQLSKWPCLCWPLCLWWWWWWLLSSTTNKWRGQKTRTYNFEVLGKSSYKESNSEKLTPLPVPFLHIKSSSLEGRKLHHETWTPVTDVAVSKLQTNKPQQTLHRWENHRAENQLRLTTT